MINSQLSLTAAQNISAFALASYLLRTGWSSAPSLVNGISIFSKQVEGLDEAVEVICPIVDTFDEALRRKADALRVIECVEERLLDVIAGDIQQVWKAEIASEITYAPISEVFRMQSLLQQQIDEQNVVMARLKDEVTRLDDELTAKSYLSRSEWSRVEVAPTAITPALFKKVNELDLSVRSRYCLSINNIIYIGDLVQKTEAEMLRMPNFGRKSLIEIKEVLAQIGLHFGMEVPGWPPEDIEALARRFEAHY